MQDTITRTFLLLFETIDGDFAAAGYLTYYDEVFLGISIYLRETNNFKLFL